MVSILVMGKSPTRKSPRLYPDLSSEFEETSENLEENDYQKSYDDLGNETEFRRLHRRIKPDRSLNRTGNTTISSTSSNDFNATSVSEQEESYEEWWNGTVDSFK